MLFVPAESFLAAALETDARLIEYAAARQVVLATPTTLIALLRTVAHGWSHEALADQAREIHRLGRELHDRLASMNGHLDQLGRSLNAAVGHYNQTVGSLETRVLVTARRFGDFGPTCPLRQAGQVDLPGGRTARRRRRRRRRPYRGPVSQRRTLWEEGREPGRQVVALAAALALTAVVLDQLACRRHRPALRRLLRARLPRGGARRPPADFFTVGVLPPLLMVGVFVLLGLTRPELIADPGDGVVQAVVSGLSHHAGALVTGYLLCLGGARRTPPCHRGRRSAWIRRSSPSRASPDGRAGKAECRRRAGGPSRCDNAASAPGWGAQQAQDRWIQAQATSKRSGSPAPTRTTSG